MSIITLPGLIDAHVHLRDPGLTHKEDFTTGTSAALAGGYTTILDMPNNAEPITTLDKLQEKIDLAEEKAVSDIGFHFGSMGDNLDEFEEASKLATGLKLYLNNTTGGYLLDVDHLKKIYSAWPKNSPVLLHAEEDVIDVAIDSAKDAQRPIHICHMPSKEILEKIIAAKKAGYPVTCGVCAHHLFLSEKDVDRLGPFGKMLPSLKTQADQDYLWEHFDDIDIIESDHAPHTKEEKEEGAFGVPGLESTLPLLLKAEKDGKLTREQLIDKCHTKPAAIFNIETDDSTEVEVDMQEYEFDDSNLFTKCGWSPFTGMPVVGKVKSVKIRGVIVFEDGKVEVEPGTGRVLGA